MLSWSPLATLWVVLGCLGALLEASGAIWWRFLAKMGPGCAQDGPSWEQVAFKMGHDSAKMTMLQFGSFWGVLGAFLVTFFAIIGKMAEV